MKKQYLILLLFFSSATYPQSIESLKTSTKKMYDANYLIDFNSIVSYCYPQMVSNAGAVKMLESVEKQYENDEYRLREQLETLAFQYGEIKNIEGKLYCVITFRNPLRYFFEKKLTPEEAVAKTTWLKEVNKTKDVTFEPNRNSFNVRKTTIYLAIMDETTGRNWKFFNFDDETQNQIFETLFGKSIKKVLNL
ncbi:hypothetical protein [Flavobacterium sp.]|uniref:hypothetical protein n=1 Tax=Flavobacterium sp. TaxID=239 RepID=UPI0025E70EC8|nr:hypothetical protein [Flavobacterium sp.]